MLAHLSLRGDLDEIYAVHDVEEAFGVQCDKAAVESWWTAGDMFDSLVLALPRGIAQDPETWERFRIALCREGGDNPGEVGRETLLIRPARGPIAWIRRLLSR